MHLINCTRTSLTKYVLVNNVQTLFSRCLWSRLVILCCFYHANFLQMHKQLDKLMVQNPSGVIDHRRQPFLRYTLLIFVGNNPINTICPISKFFPLQLKLYRTEFQVFRQSLLILVEQFKDLQHFLCQTMFLLSVLMVHYIWCCSYLPGAFTAWLITFASHLILISSTNLISLFLLSFLKSAESVVFYQTYP